MSKPFCYFFPGIIGDDGHCKRFRSIISEHFDIKIVDYPGLTDQNCLLYDFESITLHLLKKITDDGPEQFYICGYSFGGCIAFEVGRILQKKGLTATRLIIIDAPTNRMIFDLHRPYIGDELPTRGFKKRIATEILASILQYKILRLFYVIIIKMFSPKTHTRFKRKAAKVLREKARLMTWKPEYSSQSGLFFISSQFSPYTKNFWTGLCPKMVFHEVKSRHIDLLSAENCAYISVNVGKFLRSNHDFEGKLNIGDRAPQF